MLAHTDYGVPDLSSTHGTRRCRTPSRVAGSRRRAAANHWRTRVCKRCECGRPRLRLCAYDAGGAGIRLSPVCVDVASLARLRIHRLPTQAGRHRSTPSVTDASGPGDQAERPSSSQMPLCGTSR